jgi:hypothetical protein
MNRTYGGHNTETGRRWVFHIAISPLPCVAENGLDAAMSNKGMVLMEQRNQASPINSFNANIELRTQRRTPRMATISQLPVAANTFQGRRMTACRRDMNMAIEGGRKRYDMVENTTLGIEASYKRNKERRSAGMRRIIKRKE